MGVLGKDLLDFHRPRTNTKVEFGASGYWVESHPTMQPYGAVLTEILNLDAAPFQELLDQYRKTVAEKDAEQAARAFQAVTNGFASLPLYRLYWNDVQLFASMDVRELFITAATKSSTYAMKPRIFCHGFGADMMPSSTNGSTIPKNSPYVTSVRKMEDARYSPVRSRTFCILSTTIGSMPRNEGTL